MTTDTLTRDDAEALIHLFMNCPVTLREIAAHWGFDTTADYAETGGPVTDSDLYEALLCFIDASCDCDASRSNGPKRDEDTGLPYFEAGL